jgi:hypothetical protein
MRLAITLIRYFINYTVLSTRVMLPNALAVGVVLLHNADPETYILHIHALYMSVDFILLVVLKNHHQPTL